MPEKKAPHLNRFLLAPLAGYTDAPFRRVAAEWGCPGAVTEMVSAEGLSRGGKTLELLERYPGEEDLVVQLFGPDEDPVERCLPALLAARPAMVDLNCGCPVPKVVKTGAGSALMKTPATIGRMVEALKKGTDLPVSVKFRLGWDSSSMNFLEVAETAAKAGAVMLTLHARTRSQGYSGTADWSKIKELKDAFRGSEIRIFASGDIFGAEAALRCMEETGCDGVMFARGAIGNPFVFRETEALLRGETWSPTPEERVETALRHLSYMAEAHGEAAACREMRKHAVAYVKGMRGASKVKEAVSRASSAGEYREAFSLLLS